MFLNVGESSEEGVTQRRRAVEVAVVRAGLSGVKPEPLRRIEVRRIGRQREDFDVAVVSGKKLQDFRGSFRIRDCWELFLIYLNREAGERSALHG
jgi:hypothetical protein